MKTYIKCENTYDMYYNIQFKLNIDILYHHEYILIDNNTTTNITDYYFRYLTDRTNILNEVLSKNKMTFNDNIGKCNFFKSNIFIEVFNKLKEKWKELIVVYFSNNEIDIKHDKKFIIHNKHQILNIKQSITWGGIIPIPNFSDQLEYFQPKNKKKFMICRIGLVELDIINQYKHNLKNLTNIFNKYKKKICDHSSNELFKIKQDSINKHRWGDKYSENKLIYDLIRLTTNAGFYITENQNEFDILESFVTEYLNAYRNCNGLFRVDGCMGAQLRMMEDIKPHYTVYAEKDIYNLINNKSVLIISPFATQINNQIRNGNMKKLFKTKSTIIPQCCRGKLNSIVGSSEKVKEYEIFLNASNLIAIETPITIFGNPVNKSWKDTFDKTCQKIKNYCDKNKVDIVIASCGCYAMPICNYVYTKLNISSVCYGNALHQLFGIMQNDFYLFPKDSINEEYWIKIDKSVIRNERLMENMKKIDISGGKYVKNEYNFKSIITGKNVSLSDSESFISREGMRFDGGTSRLRAMIYLLSKELFDKPTCLMDFPNDKSIKGIGMSDAPEYAIPLSEKLDYTNTYYEKEPFLDIYKLSKEQVNSYDFVLSTDVFEHIPPYPGLDIAFKNLYDLLKPNGFVIFGVPFTLDDKTIEHFPNLYNYHFSIEDEIILHNQTIDDKYEKFENLCFHGGPGDITQDKKSGGSTLEMRIFCKKDLEQRFYKAGFREIEFLDIEDPVVKNHGIYWEGPWSLCMIVRK